MAKVLVKISPPLSYKISSQRVGAFILEEEIGQGETLGSLLDRLSRRNNGGIGDAIYDVQTQQITRFATTVYNGKAMSLLEGPKTQLADGDTITFLPAYAGG